ncbi:Uncharacterised protein [Raoultella terrigena]|uniref:Uncharacterized protein n=1 Tax=Raoultella terrigena TaxID=577 RepID=A0A4U9D3T0_RAOTE|nr:Uncharacterised protein [Raoultella terrigena]
MAEALTHKTNIHKTTMLGWFVVDNDGNKHVRQSF